jgi:hypothetical protein
MIKQIITKVEYTQVILGLALEHDLILLDLDDVVLTTKQYVCSSQWYRRYYQANKSLLASDELGKNVYKCMGSSEFSHFNQHSIFLSNDDALSMGN